MLSMFDMANQNVYITGDPTKSFFKVIYKKKQKLVDILGIKHHIKEEKISECHICFNTIDEISKENCFVKVCNFNHHYCLECLHKCGVKKCLLCFAEFEWKDISIIDR